MSHQICQWVYRGTPKNNNRRKVGVLVARLLHNGHETKPYLGYAAYNEDMEKGRFDKAKAKEIAEGRALKSLTGYHPVVKEFLPFNLKKAFKRFEDRARRYFKTEFANVR